MAIAWLLVSTGKGGTITKVYLTFIFAHGSKDRLLYHPEAASDNVFTQHRNSLDNPPMPLPLAYTQKNTNACHHPPPLFSLFTYKHTKHMTYIMLSTHTT